MSGCLQRQLLSPLGEVCRLTTCGIRLRHVCHKFALCRCMMHCAVLSGDVVVAQWFCSGER
jgi:hypothetical protein